MTARNGLVIGAALAAALGFGLLAAGGRNAGGNAELRAADAPALVPQESLAVALLAEARGAGPIFCELAARGASGWNGGSSTDVRLFAIGLENPRAAATVRWATEHETRDPAALPPLLRGLQDPDPCVRRIAALELGRADLPAARDALREALGSGDPGVREAGALGLGHAGDENAIGPLLGALGDDAPTVRAAGAWALGAIGSERAIEPLTALLASDPVAGVRATAAWALGEIE